LGPPRVGKTASPPLEKSWLALTMVKFTVLLPPLDELFVAETLVGDEGQ